MSEILEGHYSDGEVRFVISAFDARGHDADVDWADLFDLILEKLGGSTCEDDEPEPLDKQAFANEAERALDHDLVKGVIDEQLSNLNRESDGLARYGLTKIAMYAATVARAQALGIDPDDLRLTPQEVTSKQLKLAAEAVYRGVPTIVIEDQP